MALPSLNLTPQEWTQRLMWHLRAERPRLEELNRYYDGEQPLSYMHPDLLDQFEDRLREVIINWPQLVVDAIEERLDVEGFRRAGSPAADVQFWYWWQANGLDVASHQAHVDSLAMERSFACVGAQDDGNDWPTITVESPLEMWADLDPRTGAVRAALRHWTDGEADLPGFTRQQFATLYLPNLTNWYQVDGEKWTLLDADQHNLGEVPVVPLVNRPRLRRRTGVSELAAVIPLSDAACKIATDMMVSAEFHAMPRRWALGFNKEDFQDQNGNPMATWEQVAGAVWASTNGTQDGASVGQFPEATLANFHDTITCLAHLVGSLSGLAPYYFGDVTDQPPSADAIRAADNRLIKRTERKLRVLGGGWEQVMRIAERIMTGDWNPASRQLETIWRNPATPTKAEAADAAVKLYQGGIAPLRQTREDLGYSQVQIERMEAEDLKDDPANRLAMLDPAAAIGAKPGGLLDGSPLPAPDGQQPAPAGV